MRPSLRSVAPLPHIAFERTPGIASRPMPRGWRRREPDKTALHIVVRENLQTFLAEGRRRSDSGNGYPAFVEHEFTRYIRCGMLAWGFSRLRCPSCGLEKIVAFSCKGRMCPSCWARRTADTAAHLVDRVFPEARYRQWVLTFPWELRYHLATDRAFNSAALRIFMRTLAAWLRLRGRRLGLRDGRTGAVACLQRFGGILNLNPHIHALLPDGLFVPGPTPDANTAPAGPGLGPGVSGRLVFVPLPPPSDREFADLAVKLADRLGALARRRFKQAEEELPGLDADTLPLRTSAAESVQVPGQRPRTFDEAREPRLTVLPDKPLCSRINGFSLHAARTVEPDDRAGLERLARYCLRAPYSLDRLSLTTDGMVRYKLYRPWPTPTGRTEILLEPLAFMRRLAALLPGPYVNMIRYYGVFANRSKCRDRLPLPPLKTDAAPADAGTDPGATPAPATATATGTPDNDNGKDPTAPASTPATRGRRPRYLSWACLLKRVLDVAALSCPRCHNPMVVLAFLSDPVVVEKILKHLDLPTAPPPLGPDRRAAEEFDPCLDVGVSGDDPDDRQGPLPDPARRPRTARPPP